MRHPQIEGGGHEGRVSVAPTIEDGPRAARLSLSLVPWESRAERRGKVRELYADGNPAGGRLVDFLGGDGAVGEAILAWPREFLDRVATDLVDLRSSLRGDEPIVAEFQRRG